MAELRAIRLSRERRRDELREMAAVMRQLPSTEFDIDALQQVAEQASLALANARSELAEAENRAAERRRNLATARSEQQELIVLAEVALRHLGEHCPVCQQTYDREATREHLNSLLA